MKVVFSRAQQHFGSQQRLPRGTSKSFDGGTGKGLEDSTINDRQQGCYQRRQQGDTVNHNSNGDYNDNNDNMLNKPKEKSILNSGENNEVIESDSISQRDYSKKWLLAYLYKSTKEERIASLYHKTSYTWGTFPRKPRSKQGKLIDLWKHEDELSLTYIGPKYAKQGKEEWQKLGEIDVHFFRTPPSKKAKGALTEQNDIDIN